MSFSSEQETPSQDSLKDIEVAPQPPSLGEYFNQFRASEPLQKIIQERLAIAKKTNPQVTEKQAEIATFRTQAAKDALWDFRTAHPFVIDKTSLSP